jgi:ABC-type proline/glycine betaine transport system permease subunit
MTRSRMDRYNTPAWKWFRRTVPHPVRVVIGICWLWLIGVPVGIMAALWDAARQFGADAADVVRTARRLVREAMSEDA